MERLLPDFDAGEIRMLFFFCSCTGRLIYVGAKSGLFLFDAARAVVLPIEISYSPGIYSSMFSSGAAASRDQLGSTGWVRADLRNKSTLPPFIVL